MSNTRGSTIVKTNESSPGILRTVKAISQYRGELMGIATIWVMLLHGAELYPEINIPGLTAIANRGNLGVDMFLFLSGFGLFYSLEKNSDVLAFYKRRIIRVLIPYLLLSIPFWLYDVIRSNGDAGDFFLNLTGISFVNSGVTTTWYVFCILFLYMLYPFLFKMEKRWGAMADLFAVLFSISLCFFLKNVNHRIYLNIEIAITRIPCFILGSLYAQIMRGKTEGIKFFVLYSAFSILLFALSPFVNKVNHETGTMLYRLGGPVTILLMAACCLLMNKYRLFNRLLRHIGAVSLEMYLIHIFLRRALVDFHVSAESGVLNKCIVWTGVMLTSFVLGLLFNRVYRRAVSRFER